MTPASAADALALCKLQDWQDAINGMDLGKMMEMISRARGYPPFDANFQKMEATCSRRATPFGLYSTIEPLGWWRNGNGHAATAQEDKPIRPTEATKSTKDVSDNDATAPSDDATRTIPTSTITTVARTAFANAKLMVKRYGADIRYAPAGMWFVWDGTRWKQD